MLQSCAPFDRVRGKVTVINTNLRKPSEAITDSSPLELIIDGQKPSKRYSLLVSYNAGIVEAGWLLLVHLHNIVAAVVTRVTPDPHHCHRRHHQRR